MNQTERKRQLKNLRAKYSLLTELSREINAKLNEVVTARDQALQDIRRLQYDCTCVRLNKEIGIHDCATQAYQAREGLEMGLVSDTLSASQSCPICQGTGKNPATPLEEEDNE